MNQCKRIFIVGYPGSGKALLANTLAEKLGWQFINADFGLEFHIGRPLTEILGSEGEYAFGRCQSEILARLLTQENIVVATDASIANHEKNREMLASEFVVFLQVSTAVQVERTERNPGSLLPVANLNTFFDTLHAERDDLFAKIATITIHSDAHTLEKHVASVINKAEQYGDINPNTTELTLDKKDVIFFHKSLHVPVHLSEQQAISLKLLAQGKSSKEIAKAMHISHRTVEGTLAKAMELLGCTSSKELIVLYHGQP